MNINNEVKIKALGDQCNEALKRISRAEALAKDTQQRISVLTMQLSQQQEVIKTEWKTHSEVLMNYRQALDEFHADQIQQMQA